MRGDKACVIKHLRGEKKQEEGNGFKGRNGLNKILPVRYYLRSLKNCQSKDEFNFNTSLEIQESQGKSHAIF